MGHELKQKFYLVIASALLIATIASPASAQYVKNVQSTQGVQTIIIMEEPARWTQEDITRQQQYSTATKESIAAQQESIKNCQFLDPTQRPACIALARTTYNEEMALIRARFNR